MKPLAARSAERFCGHKHFNSMKFHEMAAFGRGAEPTLEDTMTLRLILLLGMLLGMAACGGSPNGDYNARNYMGDTYNPAHESNGGTCGYDRTCP